MFGIPMWAIYSVGGVILGEIATVTAKTTEDREGFGWELLHGLARAVAKLPTFSGSITRRQMAKKLGR